MAGLQWGGPGQQSQDAGLPVLSKTNHRQPVPGAVRSTTIPLNKGGLKSQANFINEES